jgi:hypothetical protein
MAACSSILKDPIDIGNIFIGKDPNNIHGPDVMAPSRYMGRSADRAFYIFRSIANNQEISHPFGLYCYIQDTIPQAAGRRRSMRKGKAKKTKKGKKTKQTKKTVRKSMRLTKRLRLKR